jgi:hypothetical protein
MNEKNLKIQKFEKDLIKHRTHLNTLIKNNEIPNLFIRDKSDDNNDIAPDLYAWAWYGLSKIPKAANRPVGSTNYKPYALSAVIGIICHPLLLNSKGKLRAPKDWKAKCIEFIQRTPPERYNHKNKIQSIGALEIALRREKKRIENMMRETRQAALELGIDITDPTDKK